MIEILSKSDVNKVDDEKLKSYLYKSFDRLPTDFNYPNDGYFVIVENQNEIKTKSINLSIARINGFEAGLYEDINMVEIDEEIIEILVFIDNDINVSFIMYEGILDEGIKERIHNYII